MRKLALNKNNSPYLTGVKLGPAARSVRRIKEYPDLIPSSACVQKLSRAGTKPLNPSPTEYVMLIRNVYKENECCILKLRSWFCIMRNQYYRQKCRLRHFAKLLSYHRPVVCSFNLRRRGLKFTILDMSYIRVIISPSIIQHIKVVPATNQCI